MAEKKATTKATAKKATAKKPTTKKLSVTLDAETYALLEEYIAEFGFTKDGFVRPGRENICLFHFHASLP